MISKKISQSLLLLNIIHVVSLIPATSSFQIVPVQKLSFHQSSTRLHGKLWDKLECEPDPMDEDAVWYLMNCIVGTELDLLAQAKHVTKDLPTECIEKLAVPTERKVRSHGKTQTVVEVKVMYPGYVFCKMRLCAETYEPLQQLPLCRSWMAGTVNQKGYKKLPSIPIALADDEVEKFKGLEEKTNAMHEKYGEDYTGRGDDGSDLIDQYEGHKVENMVKILDGNFKGEDGIVRRLKDGLIMVRLYTYGNMLDQWFKPSEIRPMTDAEAMKGLTGPNTPVNQDSFDMSIGKKPKPGELRGGRGLRSDLMGSMGGDNRMRRQDRVNRGEHGNKDIHGRTEQGRKEEEENWRQFREEQRASQQQKRGDMWGIKERFSWDSGDNAAQFVDGKWKSGRQSHSEQKEKPKNSSSKSVQNALDGDNDWDSFADNSPQNESNEKGLEDDFFDSLMSELSDSLDTDSSNKSIGDKGPGKKSQSAIDAPTDENDFFTDLMSQLSEVDNIPDKKIQNISSQQNVGQSSNGEDDFFASLEADLNESLGQVEANVDNEKDSILDSRTSSNEDDFFTNLESELGDILSVQPESISPTESLEGTDPKGKSNERTSTKKDSNPEKKSKSMEEGIDYSTLTVSSLKDLLRNNGLKVSGKKSELIDRLKKQS